MKPLVSLTQAMADRELFGRVFEAPSFWTWRVVAKLIDGLPLTEQREIDLFHECTGRTKLPTGPIRDILLLCGRRAGKDRFLSAVAVHRAALCCDWRKYASPGEQMCVLLLGADRRQAMILRKYCGGLLEAPRLKREVRRDVRSTENQIEFRNGAMLEVGTNDARLIRGRSAIAILGSELAHWKVDENSASSDEEVVGAATPSMAMTPDGGLLLLGSSIYRKRGYAYRRFKELHGNDDEPDALCWFATSQTMNPTLPQSVIDKALRQDAPKARAEFLNCWREDLSDFIPLDILDACTDFDVTERPPQSGIRYTAFCDSAGGTGKDSFSMAIAHQDTKHVVTLDLLRERKPRFVAAEVVKEFAADLKRYKINEIHSDGFSGGFHSDAWVSHGIKFVPSERTTSENYLALLPLLTEPKRVRLLNDHTLRSQLAGLERRVTAARESVTHAATQSAHDDVACAAAGAVVLAAARPAYDGEKVCEAIIKITEAMAGYYSLGGMPMIRY
jgi:hypothetical protein